VRPLSELILDYFLPYEEAVWPLDIEAQWGRSSSLAVELGFGDGAYLAALANERPDWNILGVELAWDPVQWCLKKLEKLEQRSHVKILRADARLVVSRLLPANSVDEFVINHPDPWPKDRHHRRRLIQSDFIEDIAVSLKPGGRMTLATDHAEYAAWIETVLGAQDHLRPVHGTPWVREIPGRLVTRYQRKAQTVGIQNHFFVWEKGKTPSPPRPTWSPDDMPNVTLTGRVDAANLFDGFRTAAHRELIDGVDILIRHEKVWKSPDRDRWLVETLVQDGPFHQHLAFIVEFRGSDEVILKLSSLGHPRVTTGVKRALFQLARALLQRHGALAPRHSTVGALD